MKKIAEALNFHIIPNSPIYKVFSRLGNWFGGYTLRGILEGKTFEIFTTKFSDRGRFPVRLVVKTPLGSGKTFKIVIQPKPLLVSLHKIFDKNIFFSGNRILDNRILFSTDDRNLLSSILRYEEIEDQLHEIWKGGKRVGTLLIGGHFIAYHEPFHIITETTRTRIKNVTRLIGDIADAVNFHFHSTSLASLDRF